MTYTVTITSQGQISIPAKIRRKLGFSQTMKASVSIEDGKMVVSPIKDLLELAGSLSSYKKRVLSPSELHEQVAKAVSDEYALKLKK